MIEVPYWWNRTVSSLAVTVYNVRPDLFKEKPQGNPIPLLPTRETNLPRNSSKNAFLTGQTELLDFTRKILMTATEWEESMDPTGWYMTEKYDGMRLYWDGKKCFSRLGEEVKMPESILNKLPSIALDGELW